MATFPRIISNTKFKTVGSFSRRIDELTTKTDFLRTQEQKTQARDLRKRSLNFHRFLTVKAPTYEVAQLEVNKISRMRSSQNLTLRAVLQGLEESEGHSLRNSPVDRSNILRVILGSFDSIDPSLYGKIVDLIPPGGLSSSEEARLLVRIYQTCIAQSNKRVCTESTVGKIASRILRNRNLFDTEFVKRVDRAACAWTESALSQCSASSHAVLEDALEYLGSVPSLNGLHFRILRRVKHRLIELCDDAHRKFVGSTKPRFVLFADSDTPENHSKIVPMAINYFGILKTLDTSTRTPRVYYSQLSRGIEKILRICSTPVIERMKVVIGHHAAGLGTLRIGTKLVDDWIRANRRLSSAPRQDLETVMHCARVSRYAHQYRLGRLKYACSKNNIEVETAGTPIPDRILTSCLHRRSWRRPFRRRLHEAMNSLRVERLNAKYVKKLANANPYCNKTDCHICVEFTKRIALARCFHFPTVFH